MVKLLFIGDIVGRPGRSFVFERLPEIRKELEVDFVVANAENSAGGAVFSTGSITFCGSLPFNNFDNNISKLLSNIFNRFLSAE